MKPKLLRDLGCLVRVAKVLCLYNPKLGPIKRKGSYSGGGFAEEGAPRDYWDRAGRIGYESILHIEAILSFPALDTKPCQKPKARHPAQLEQKKGIHMSMCKFFGIDPRIYSMEQPDQPTTLRRCDQLDKKRLLIGGPGTLQTVTPRTVSVGDWARGRLCATSVC